MILTIALILSVRGDESNCSAGSATGEVKLPLSFVRLREKLAAASPTCLDDALRSSGGVMFGDGELPRASVGSAQALAACRLPLLLPRSTLVGWRALESWVSDDYLAHVLPTSLVNAFVAPREEAGARDALVAVGGQLDVLDGVVKDPAPTGGTSRPALAEDPTGDPVEAFPTAHFFSDESAVYFARWMGSNDMATLRADTAADALLVDDGVQGAEVSTSQATTTTSRAAAERRYFRLGSVGSVSTLHYDDYHNVFVQVSTSSPSPRA